MILVGANLKRGGKEIKYPGNELQVYSGGEINEYENVEIKGRGNSTWDQAKKPLQIKLDKADDLLGLGKAKKWVFLANYHDKSYIRSDAAFAIAEMVGEKYSQRGKFVELYVNGEYEGMYYVLKRIEISKNVVDLRDEKGILVELDNLHNYAEFCTMSYGGNCLLIKDTTVDGDDNKASDSMEKFMVDFNELEKAAEEKNYKNVIKVADIDSLAKYFLVNEFTINPDAYSTSFYFYKDGENDNIHSGPVWDFDLALGNREWVWDVLENVYLPTQTLVRKPQVFGENGLQEDKKTAKLFYYLMEMPEFKKEVKRVFHERMSGRGQELELMMKNVVKSIRSAALEDSIKWGRGDFDAETKNLLDWVQARYEYFEETYGEDVDLLERPVL